MRDHRGGVLARLADHEVRPPGIPELTRGAEHRLGASVGEQLAIDQAGDRLWRPLTNLLPDPVDERARRLIAYAVGQAGAPHARLQRRRDHNNDFVADRRNACPTLASGRRCPSPPSEHPSSTRTGSP